MGPITLAQLAGVSTGTVVCAVTALALGGFFVFGRMRRSDGAAADTGNTRNRALLATATTLALAAVLFDVHAPVQASPLAAAAPSEHDFISAIDLGERIAQGDQTLRVIDLRDESSYAQLHIPAATRATVADLATTAFPKDATIVLYDDTGATATQGQALLRQSGHASVHVLREGLYEWIARVQEPRLASDPTFAEREAFERAAKLSRFFGGVPKAGVPRAEVPRGYWTGAAPNADVRARSRDAIEALRRRGC
jgi:rhodanese-related sulfurtransferase